MAAVTFKDLSKSAAKFTQNGAQGQTAYVANASAAAQRWNDHTVASEANYVAGVQAAASRGAFGKGVTKAGPAKYAKQINAVAGPRFADGIGKAGPTWQAGFAPAAQFVSSVDIGNRGLRGSQANKARSSAMQDAFHAYKVGKTA